MPGIGSWLSSASSVNAVDRTWLRGDGKVCLGSVDHTESISTFSPTCAARLRDGSSRAPEFEDGLRERLRRFLRQVVADPALERPVRVRA